MTFDIGFGHDTPIPTVSVRQSWADAWTSQPYIIVDSINYTVGGAFGKASLRYEYGEIKQTDSGKFETVAKLDIDRYYVRIAYTPNTTDAVETYWYGVIVSTSDEQVGNSAGNQQFVAVTLDWLLTQKQVTTSWVADGNAKKEVYRPIAFNMSEGDTTSGPNKVIANRNEHQYETWGAYPVYTFAESTSYAQLWTAADILLYVMRNYPPNDGDGPTWTVHNGVTSHIGWMTPAYPVDGRTVYEVVNGLVDSRRGLAWYVEATEAGCEINVCSYSSSAIELGDGSEIPANAATAVTIDDEIQAAQAVTLSDSQNYYSQVRVTGARRGCCFSISPSDGTMLADWTNADAATYLNGDTTATGDHNSNRNALNDTFRNSLAMRHVYTRYHLPDNWDGFAQGSYVCPVVDPYTGTILAGGEPLWQTGLRFKQRLPLRRFYNYSDSIENPTDNTPDSGEAEFIRSFAVGWVGSHRVLTHELQSWSSSELNPELEMSASVVVSDDSPTLWVQPSNVPHALAYGDYPDGFPYSDNLPAIDWQTMIATVFVEWDTLSEAVYPEEPYPPFNDQESVLTLRLGERYRMDYVQRGTVLDVKEGDVVTADEDGFVRNDHPVMRDMAKLAWEWYSTPRKAVRMNVSHIASDLSIGDLVTTLDGDTVNSLVTGLTYDFVRGTTNIETQFANLDARQLLG